MKKKGLMIFLLLEAAACAAFCLTRAELSGLAGPAPAFPFAQIAAALRALSLTGRVGNAFAVLLWVAIGLLPAGTLLLTARRRKLRGGDTLPPLASALLLAALLLMARPGTLSRLTGGLGADYGSAALGTALWSVLAAWAVIEALRRLRDSDGAALSHWGRGLLSALAALFVFLIFGSGLSSLLAGLDAVKEANTSPDAALGLTNGFLIIRWAVNALPWALCVAITLRGLGLVDAMSADRYSEETAAAAAGLTALCSRSLAAVMLTQAGVNLAQLLFAGALRDVSLTASFPVFSVAFVFAALLLSRLLGENKALKDDNDLFV